MAPIRVVLYENDAGHGVFEYDQPFNDISDRLMTSESPPSRVGYALARQNRADPARRTQTTGELLFVANAVNADDCARCVFDRLIAGDGWYAKNRCLAVVWFTCAD
jgi:hypothetical protein